MSNKKPSQNDIAIIGMSGRFPGARDVAEFWRNLCQGTESLTMFSQDEIDEYLSAMDYAGAGLAEQQSNNPNYIRAGFVLDDIDMFDASFFGYNPSEAELIDPQHRIFLETAWHAFEDAGYDPAECDYPVGVFAGTSMSQYYTVNIFSNREIYYSERDLTALIGNEVDYLPTRVSYKLNLRGPSMSVQSACSSSMVAIHLACRSLLNHECDMALAGGSFVQVPQTKGYMYREGGLLSRDGHCRVFDAGASGTVFSNGGVGGVVLKRLGDAMNDGDHIYAVVKGTAVDNDGSEKPAMTAPTVKGQMAVIKSALQAAGIEPHQISYVEAHGTGTLLGDPIEVSSLTHVFRETTDTRNFCGIGSLKTNVGHLDRVSGVAGFIKAAMALEHKQIPPSLNFDVPNPRIDFDNSPFYVNTELRSWDTDQLPRRVGVNSFGVGGTNAHAILEEAPLLPAADPGRQWQLLSVSARTPQALDAATGNLIDYLQNNPDRNLADIAYTLHCGRRDFSHRRIVAAENIKQAIELLSSGSPKQLVTGSRDRIDRELTFMFSGQGSQYVNMGLELYQNEASFRQTMDACAELLKTYIGCDILEILYPTSGTEQQAAEKLKQTSITQPALFMIEYSLASLLMSWGIKPRAMIGHSIGEYVAACLAGVFDLESALRLVAKRGELMQQMPPGDMLAVNLPEQQLLPMLGSELSLAAINAPDSCVVSGDKDAIDNLELMLSANISCQRLHTSHAFHSLMMEPILEPFIEVVKQIKLQPPQLQYQSNLTGTWITAEQATDPQYWVDHLRNAVRFADGIKTLVEHSDRLLLEVGPGHVLSSLARQSLADSNSIVLPTMHHPKEQQPAQGYLLQAIGRLWIAGGEIDWKAFYPERRHRLSMPTYPFERMRYWVEARKQGDGKDLFRTRGLDDWFYLPYWKRMLPPAVADEPQTDSRWLLFADEQGFAEAIVDLLKSSKCPVTVVYPGEHFVASGQSFNINPQSQDDYDQLVAALSDAGHMPDHVLHLWTLSNGDELSYEESQNRGFYSLLYLAQAVGKMDFANDIAITAISNGLHDVTGEELLYPQKASILGTCKVIPLEYPNIRCRSVDIDFNGIVSAGLIKQLVTEASYDADDRVVAYRNDNRWLQDYENIQLPASTPELPSLKQQGVYLITGGLGGIGMAVAEYMASRCKAKLALTGRSALPDEAEWDAWLASHPATDGNSEKIRKIRELRSLGAEVRVYSADVSNYQQMQNVVADIHDSFGAINGVIHSAGVAGGGMIQLKSHDMAERVLQPKIKGCLVLEQLLADDKLDLFVLCSSLFSVVGGIGQVDYCAANSFMDAFAQSRNGKNGEVCVSINWDAWQDIGMAVKAMEQQQTPMTREPLAGKDSGHPLLGVRTDETAERIIYSSYLGIDEQWVLAEHKIAGSNIVPGTGYLEWCRAAVLDSSTADSVEISDVLFMKPLEVQQQEQKACRLVLDGANGNYIVSIQSSSAMAADGSPIWDEHFTARATAASRRNMDQLDLQKIRASCIKQSYDLKGRFPAVSDNWEDQGFIQFGPRWTNINQLHLGDRQALIELQLADEFEDDLAIYKLHPSLLDMATGPTIAPLVAGDDTWDGELYLPFSYGKLVWHAPLTKKIYSHVTYRSSESDEKETLSQDVRVFDEDGRLLVEVEAFTLRKIHEGALKTQQQIDHDAVRAADFGDARSTSRSEDMKVLGGDGIPPKDGIEAFSRIISQNPPSQLVVATADLKSLLADIANISRSAVEEISQSGASRTAHPRPNISTPYTEPESALEKLLAEIWQGVLGIDRVGLHDNFFELGADSVLGIQVISRARGQGVTLNPAQLFEHQTIAELALVAENKSSSQPEIRAYPLTPAQSWLPVDVAGGHAQCFVVEPREHMRADALFAVVQAMVQRHDALRLRLTKNSAAWQQDFADPQDAVGISSVADSGDDPRTSKALLQIIDRVNRADNELVHFVLMSSAAAKLPQLAIVVHDCVADAAAMKILLEELVIAYQQFASSGNISWQVKSQGYIPWLEKLADYAGSAELREQQARMLAALREHSQPLPYDGAGMDVEDLSRDTLSISLSKETSGLLLGDVNRPYKTHTQDILLAALLVALRKQNERQAQLVNLVFDGRDTFRTLDLSQTVGQFMTACPSPLQLPAADGYEDVIRSIKEQLRTQARQAMAYGVLLQDPDHQQAAAAFTDDLCFYFSENHTDELMEELELGSLQRLASAVVGDPYADSPHALNILASVQHGCLQLDWRYRNSCFQQATIQSLMDVFIDELNAAIAHCLSTDRVAYTVSDFPEANLQQGELDDLLDTIGDMES